MDAEEAGASPREQLVTLDQLGLAVGRSKVTMKRIATKIPGRRTKGCRSHPAEWAWAEARVWLMRRFDLPFLPDVFPDSQLSLLS